MLKNITITRYHLLLHYYMVKEIIIEHALHDNRMGLFMKFDYDLATIELVKAITDAKWSHSKKSWQISFYPEALNLIINTF
jgi:hypothetical protein